MSAFANVTKDDMINLAKLSEQQKNQTTEKIKNIFLGQTHDGESAKVFSLITEKLSEGI